MNSATDKAGKTVAVHDVVRLMSGKLGRVAYIAAGAQWVGVHEPGLGTHEYQPKHLERL